MLESINSVGKSNKTKTIIILRHWMYFDYIYFVSDEIVRPVVVAEWLRRLTRNQMGYARTGSNPVHDDYFFFFYLSILS